VCVCLCVIFAFFVASHLNTHVCSVHIPWEWLYITLHSWNAVQKVSRFFFPFFHFSIFARQLLFSTFLIYTHIQESFTRDDEFRQSRDHFVELAQNVLSSVESDHLALFLLDIPTDCMCHACVHCVFACTNVLNCV